MKRSKQARIHALISKPITLLMLKSIGITLFAYILSVCLTAPFSASVSVLFSSAERNDFVLSDLFAQVADGRPVRNLDDRIVLIDIGHSGRGEIAEILNILALCGPKAVGVDVLFEDPREGDEELIEAVSNLPGIVMPMVLEQDGDKFKVVGKSYFCDSLENIEYGVVNLPTKNEGASVREYIVDFELENGEKVPSFVTALTSVSNPDRAKELRSRGVEKGIIYYPSKQFTVIPHDDLADRAEELIDKIVLVGSMVEATDMHRTPINSYMSGATIHAHALSTVLDGIWLKSLPGWVDTVVAILLCFIIVMTTLGIKSGIRGLIVRILQILFVYLVVRMGYHYYVDKYLICDFPKTLLMTAFGLFAVDIWNGVAVLLLPVRNKIKELKKS